MPPVLRPLEYLTFDYIRFEILLDFGKFWSIHHEQFYFITKTSKRFLTAVNCVVRTRLNQVRYYNLLGTYSTVSTLELPNRYLEREYIHNFSKFSSPPLLLDFYKVPNVEVISLNLYLFA